MAPIPTDKNNQLGLSWQDPAWVPHLSKENVLDYFSERSNPFYDRTCNNETIKMQRLGLEHLENMVGLEYVLLHHQAPILYVIRKQRRQSPKQVTTIADYHIIAGTVYQSPDLSSICNSRLMTTFHRLEAAFSEALSYSRYHPAKGYSWQFNKKDQKENKKPAKVKEEPGSSFQCRRVDVLLSTLTSKFPHKFVQTQPGEKPVPTQALTSAEVKPEKLANPAAAQPLTAAPRPPVANVTVKQEPKPPPDKRMKFM
uniref:Mediator of RNA polymerase II transcription subunit 6 n=1 Tax=Phallusia mammillata TaxID=59560 RepID=A0A6F9DLF3_9ASCI|nr:mediator of RNA polymerase II transcription subunit 6-like [Phallusia mammillata]